MRQSIESWRNFARSAGVGFALAASVVAPGWADDASAPALRESASDAQPETVPETVIVKAPKPEDVDYHLGAGDALRITVFEEADLSGDFRIDSAGFIRLPMIGDIKAVGLTAHELEARIKAELDDGYLKDARVAIDITTYRPFYIIGQVSKPGEYAYVSNMSALNAIALAGGFTEKAVESTLYVRHEGETEEHAVPADQLARIYPGDVVRVPETAFWSVADVVSPLTGLGYVLAQVAP